MNQIVKQLTIDNFNNFEDSFVNAKKVFWSEKDKKLIHPGEYGEYREDLVKKWLKMYVPEKFGIGSGFVIGSNGYVSTQYDIIIYDKEKTPIIEDVEKKRFFPVETVSCVGEVKSDIKTMDDLKSYLKKLLEVKKEKENIKDPSPYCGFQKDCFSPKQNQFHNIFTFLICNKFNFSVDLQKINYTKEYRYKHNLVLSLQDGILNYSTPSRKTKNLCFPIMKGVANYDNFIKKDNLDLSNTVISFISSLQMALNNNVLLDIDMTLYLTDKIIEKIE